MLNLYVKFNKAVELRGVFGHIPGATEKALVSALNKAASEAKKAAIEEALEHYTLSRREFEMHIKIIKATQARLKASFIMSSPLLSIPKFNVKKGRFTTTEIRKGQSKKWQHGFLAQMGSGHLGVFGREKEYSVPTKNKRIKTRKATRGVDRGAVGEVVRRQKITERYSVSATQITNRPQIMDEILRIANEKLAEELDKQIWKILRENAA